ncbi:unnamed protein product [Rhizoctonia solani]|uniref:Uncharacterized protein n=3 Tax=Rhizoctonia solani TaxID=456999 RepID=A0A8H2XR50_9AGAM|nr:hypothetical protein RSOL_050350 [Rhizoctonia solani AG-3 Rhs1AP]KEP46194.1 hypothetical protein V565_213010 [Rhizoctonia solani 123E]CAE6434344.1 unnamed protein product [Rhizoctonia solani]CAE6505882.1 unnamed protein product [Rhizoctonia solani]
MPRAERTIEFIPTSFRQRPPTKYYGKEENGRDVYMWYITESEYLRLNTLFRRDFQETGLGGTLLYGLPSPCPQCGKYQEFIDWVWTALMRNVHSSDFIFNALAKSRQGMETEHDVYCSECGTLTVKRQKDAMEGGAPDIYLARRIDISGYRPTPQAPSVDRKSTTPAQAVTWGKWWLDNNGKCLVTKYGDKVPESSA